MCDECYDYDPSQFEEYNPSEFEDLDSFEPYEDVPDGNLDFLGEVYEASFDSYGNAILDPARYYLSRPAEELSSHQLGVEGEHIAEQYLIDEGYDILCRNWRCRYGEADIVARDSDGTVAMVEVKTRRVRRFQNAVPELAVNEEKQGRYAKIAARYLSENGPTGSVRFDVVAITVRGEEPIHARLVRSAFVLDR